MGAIQYLPVREYVPWSPRALGKGWAEATSYSMPPEEMVNFWMPHFSGILDRYWGDNLIHLHSEYLGVAVILLAALAFARGRLPVSRKLVWFFTGVTIIALLWALGGNTPFYRIVYALVPGTKFFRAPSTMLYVVSFGVAVLAAFGAERAVNRDVSRRYLIGWAVAVLGIGVIGATGGLTNLGVALAQPRPDGARARERRPDPGRVASIDAVRGDGAGVPLPAHYRTRFEGSGRLSPRRRGCGGPVVDRAVVLAVLARRVGDLRRRFHDCLHQGAARARQGAAVRDTSYRARSFPAWRRPHGRIMCAPCWVTTATSLDGTSSWAATQRAGGRSPTRTSGT